ncbi:MAG: hypothetical protein GOU98_01810 [Candidatus Altiarchaeota archaeon]|nr:hypothetical protein [Candidatus Altiarchaeota archaeon]
MARFESKEKPVFADEVMVSFVIKRNKDGTKKDAAVRLSFIDSMKKASISEVVISPVTAEAFAEVLTKTSMKLTEALEGKLPKKKTEEAATYIG